MPQRTLRALAALLLAACSLPSEAEERERVYFSVRNRDRKPVLRLTSSDFTLRVDGKAAALDGFEAPRPGASRTFPLALAIVLDASPRIEAEVIERQADAAAAVFDLLHPDSLVGVQICSDRLETAAPLAHDAEALRRAFRDYRTRRTEVRASPERGTVVLGEHGLPGAVEEALDAIDRCVSARPDARSFRRAVMILTAGDRIPGRGLDGVVEHAARDSASVYPVLLGPPRAWFSWRELERLAERSGGLISLLGSLAPGAGSTSARTENVSAGALRWNLLHLLRDLEGKYAFARPAARPGGPPRLELKSRRRDVRVALPQTGR